MNEEAADPKMEKKCPQCGTPLTAGGLAGLCPACLLKQATTETATQPDAKKFKPPTVEELARLFPQLEILSLIGKGGMGAVYKARQPMLDRIVALKILPAQVTLGTDFGDRFTREARALAKLNHPNIVMVYEFGQLNGQPYFIMEYVDGLNLRQLEQEGKLTPREALLIVPQICEALQFAHDAGIVHRDIKPDNILLDKKGRVKIADFGIAKILGTAEDPAIPVTQGAIGTPHYMAPEQVEKPQTVDHRADIFSLGVVFYEMLTGELPLGKFAAPSSGPRGLQVDVRLDEVVLRALERKPELRYQHASQVKTAVENIASTQLGDAAGAHPHVQAPEALLAQDYTLGIRRSLRRGWTLVKKNFWPLVGMTMLILALMSIADSAFTSTHHESNGVTTEGLSVLALLLNGPLLAGLFLYFLKKIRGEAATVETAFAGFFSKRFLHLFLAHFVVTALTVLGFLCLILPGIYLMVAWSFTLALIIDKGLGFLAGDGTEPQNDQQTLVEDAALSARDGGGFARRSPVLFDRNFHCRPGGNCRVHVCLRGCFWYLVTDEPDGRPARFWCVSGLWSGGHDGGAECYRHSAAVCWRNPATHCLCHSNTARQWFEPVVEIRPDRDGWVSHLDYRGRLAAKL